MVAGKAVLDDRLLGRCGDNNSRNNFGQLNNLSLCQEDRELRALEPVLVARNGTAEGWPHPAVDVQLHAISFSN